MNLHHKSSVADRPVARESGSVDPIVLQIVEARLIRSRLKSKIRYRTQRARAMIREAHDFRVGLFDVI